MTVFVVMFYGIDEAEIEAVFATHESAQAYIDNSQSMWKDYLQIVEMGVQT